MQGFGGEPKGGRPLGKCRKKWEDNIVWILRKLDVFEDNRVLGCDMYYCLRELVLPLLG